MNSLRSRPKERRVVANNTKYPARSSHASASCIHHNRHMRPSVSLHHEQQMRAPGRPVLRRFARGKGSLRRRDFCRRSGVFRALAPSNNRAAHCHLRQAERIHSRANMSTPSRERKTHQRENTQSAGVALAHQGRQQRPCLVENDLRSTRPPTKHSPRRCMRQ